MLNKAQKEVLDSLGVSEREFESSVEKFMEEGSQELFLIHSSLPQRMK